MTAPPAITSELLTNASGVRHGFFGRRGGVSKGAFDSLNCGPYSGDDARAIEENRRRVSDALGAGTLLTNRQVHSPRVRVVGRDTGSDERFEGDGLVTADRGICLGALGADCAPVLFADVEAGLVGAAHAGWKGALEGVTDRLVETMEGMGAVASRIICAVGPTIQYRSYEVGEEFVERFLARSPVACETCFGHPEPGSRPHFDLPAYLRRRLEEAGLVQIDILDHDTYAGEASFFSYRRNGHRGIEDYGRQVGAIALAR